MNTNIKLNVGCGSDYKDGFINIDASNSLNRVDKIIDLEKESLLKQFLPESCGFILANDIVEHLYHWQAVQLLTDFYTLLASGGSLEVRVPDTEYIIKSWSIPLRQKVFYLYGGQDIPQGGSVDMENSRRENPNFFCHKYGWTRSSLHDVLSNVGFLSSEFKRVGTNIIVTSTK